jgi:O-antigen/teichoic acid export membrane protein
MRIRIPRVSGYWRDVSWVMSGALFAQLINLVGLPVLTRLYEPASFAAVALLVNVSAVIGVFMTLRYEYAIPLPRSRFSMDCAVALCSALVLIGVVFWTLVAALFLYLYHDSDIGQNAYVIALAPLAAGFQCGGVAFAHATQRLGGYRKTASAEIASKAGYILAALAFVNFPSPLGLLLAYCLGAASKLLLLVNWPLLKSLAIMGIRRRSRVRTRIVFVLRKYRGVALSLVVSGAIVSFTGLAPTIFVSDRYGPDALGQFALVLSTTYLPSALIGAAMGAVYFQRAAKLHAAGASIFSLWQETARKLVLMALAVFATLYLLSTWLYPFLFGSSWKLAGEIAQTLAPASALAFASTPLDKTSSIVGVWKYMPGWHVVRLFTVCAVILVADKLNWTMLDYCAWLAIQSSVMYAIDFIAQGVFAANAQPVRARGATH